MSYDHESISFGKFEVRRFSGTFSRRIWMIFKNFWNIWKKSSFRHLGQFRAYWYSGTLGRRIFWGFFYSSCYILRFTCRMIIILLPLERATIRQHFRYLQHVDRPSEKFFRWLWNEVLLQNYDFPRNLNLRSEVCFSRFFQGVFTYPAMCGDVSVVYDHNFVIVRKSYN